MSTSMPNKRLGRAIVRRRSRGTSPLIFASAIATATLVAAALINRQLTKAAERNNPPVGRFLDVNGVRLHYVEKGTGKPLVLLHGNGSMIQDFEASGLIDLAANDHRVIVFDRPGFGYSDRPRSVIWTPDAQAEVITAALAQLDVRKAIVLGHSWGASVAIAMALKHPTLVEGLVLASGYYYPTPRLDVVAMGAPALPIVGDVLSHTILPILSRLTWPLGLRKIFGPNPVPEKFEGFSKELALRPSQLRASAAETAMMVPDAFAMDGLYKALKMPVVIIAGEEDKVVDSGSQSARLHSDISHSRFHRIAGNGHMIQQTATGQVMSAIKEVAGETHLAAAE